MDKFVYKYNENEAENIYFTSDTHFHHKNILQFCNRPFSSIEEHDAELIRRWNDKVPENGIVFHLGDFAFASSRHINYILDRLNGKIFLIIGNHDWRNIVKCHSTRIELMTQQLNLKIEDQHIILNHYPFLCYSGVYHKNPSWQLYGHVHSGPYSSNGKDISRLEMCYSTQYDVGVDNNNFTPISFYEIKNKINSKIINSQIDKNAELFRNGEISYEELHNKQNILINKIKKYN